jgi:hypothetical protein
MNEKKLIFSPTIIGILVFSIITPAYGEVISLNIDKINYILGDEITFSGTVEEGASSLVSVVIRDHTNEFVMLTQALIKQDNTFQRSIDINQKFTKFGFYNATAFIFNMTGSERVTFELFDEDSLPEVSQSKNSASNEFEINLQEKIVVNEQNNLLPNDTSQITSEKKDEKLADFIDPNKDPQHYLERYYNEPNYKDWFDRNYPDLTIEEAVGTSSNFIITETIDKNLENIIPDEIIPDAEAISVVIDSLNSDSADSREAALFGLALGGLAVLFIAVYGIKKRVDTNLENISQNRESIKKKMFGSLFGRDPIDVVKNRLANGEITIVEYNQLKKALEQK